MTIWPRKHKRKTPSQAFTIPKKINHIGRAWNFAERYYITDCHCFTLQTVALLHYRLSLYYITDCHCITLQTVTVLHYILSLYNITDCHCITLHTVTVLHYRLSLYYITDWHCITLQSVTVLHHFITLLLHTITPHCRTKPNGNHAWIL